MNKQIAQFTLLLSLLAVQGCSSALNSKQTPAEISTQGSSPIPSAITGQTSSSSLPSPLPEFNLDSWIQLTKKGRDSSAVFITSEMMSTQGDNTTLWIASAYPSGGKIPLTRSQVQIDCSRQRIKTLAEEIVIGEYPSYGKEFRKASTTEWNEKPHIVNLISPICNYISTVPPDFQPPELNQPSWVPVATLSRAGIGTPEGERIRTLQGTDFIVYFKLPGVVPEDLRVSSWLSVATKSDVPGISPSFRKVEVDCFNNQIRVLGPKFSSDTSEFKINFQAPWLNNTSSFENQEDLTYVIDSIPYICKYLTNEP